jgi:lipid-A-disaccharide synthase
MMVTSAGRSSAKQEAMPSTIFISAGEASGEHYGALLIAALRDQLAEAGQTASFFGMGGPRMAAEGLECVVRSEDMAVMGLTEVVRHLPRIYREFRRLKQSIRARRPSVAVLIDFPEIHFRLAREFHRLGVPVVYFVSPQLWAWKKKRIRLVRKYIDKMLVIFPFEEPFYRGQGVEAEFVGHPLAELAAPTVSREHFAAANGLDPLKTWIGLLPGSRAKEIRDILPEMLRAARELVEHSGERFTAGPDVLKGHGFSRAANSPKTDAALATEGICPAEDGFHQGLKPSSSLGNFPARLKPCPFKADSSSNAVEVTTTGLEFLIPLAPTLNAEQREEVRQIVATHGGGLALRLVDDARAALFHSLAAIVASGTATVEAALIGNPFVVVYRVSRLTFAIAKRVVKVPFVSMANLIAGKQVVPELLQDDFSAENIVQQIKPLLADGPARQSMMEELARIRGLLATRPTGSNEGGAIGRVAEVTLEVMRRDD